MFSALLCFLLLFLKIKSIWLMRFSEHTLVDTLLTCTILNINVPKINALYCD